MSKHCTRGGEERGGSRRFHSRNTRRDDFKCDNTHNTHKTHDRLRRACAQQVTKKKRRGSTLLATLSSVGEVTPTSTLARTLRISTGEYSEEWCVARNHFFWKFLRVPHDRENSNPGLRCTNSSPTLNVARVVQRRSRCGRWLRRRPSCVWSPVQRRSFLGGRKKRWQTCLVLFFQRWRRRKFYKPAPAVLLPPQRTLACTELHIMREIRAIARTDSAVECPERRSARVRWAYAPMENTRFCVCGGVRMK